MTPFLAYGAGWPPISEKFDLRSGVIEPILSAHVFPGRGWDFKIFSFDLTSRIDFF